MRHGRAPTVLAGAASCVTVLAACGGGSNASTKQSAASNSALELAQCMRAHGVPNFPDPTKSSGGEGFSIVQASGSSAIQIDGISFSGPKFQSAEKTCKLSGPGGGAGLSEAQQQGFIAKARCIRKHGVPNFPDPRFGPGGRGIMTSLGPDDNPDSPAIKQALKACAGVGTPLPGV
jgi:hypothetical protein